jgi:hypothetical protein
MTVLINEDDLVITVGLPLPQIKITASSDFTMNLSQPNVILQLANQVIIPGPKGTDGAAAAKFVFTQTEASDTWTVNHNLGTKPLTSVLSSGGLEIEALVLHTTVNQLTVQLNSPFTGQVICQ